MAHARRRREVSSQRRRVLVVEDDDSFAEALTELLEADGRLEVAGRARDGREAIELAEALRPDVVLQAGDPDDGDGRLPPPDLARGLDAVHHR
jgi:DNA-binding NarL/FixJ family response regulator